MWLLKAHGSVNGQDDFTFVLERDRRYVIGRDKAADIRFADKAVRPKEGILEVDDWDPYKSQTPPRLIWRAEPKRNGTFPPLKTLSQRPGLSATYRRDDYEMEERDGADEFEFARTGNGINLGPDVNFYAEWQDLRIAYEGMKNEPMEVTKVLKDHCVSCNTKTEEEADIAIAEERGGMTTSLAVCYGIPIVTPQWLQILIHRLKVCWKKNADSEDSFVMPDEADYVPPMKAGLPPHRSDPGAWRIDRANRSLLSGYCVIGLVGPRKPMKDSVYVTAMGGTYQEVDIVSRPPVSAEDFLDRIASIQADAEADGRHVILAFLPSLRKELEAKNINWTAVLKTPAETHGMALAGFGPMIWGVVRCGGVNEYFQTKVGDNPQQTAAAETPATGAVSEEPAAVEPDPTPLQTTASAPRRLTRRAGAASRSVSRAPSPQPDVVPSTYPEGDTLGPARAHSPPPPAVPPVSPPKEAVKRPLRRRAGRPKVDIDAELDMDDVSPASTQPQSSFAPETQLSSGVHGTQRVPEAGPPQNRIPDSMDVNTQMTMPPPAQPRTRGKLKRRAGATQSSAWDIDTTIDYEEELKKTEKDKAIRDLYEQTVQDSEASLSAQPVRKRQRTHAPRAESIDEIMEVDDEDIVTKAIRTTRSRQTASPSKAPALPATRKKTPPPPRKETPEEEDDVAPTPPPKKGRANGKSTARDADTNSAMLPSQIDRDPAFLQAIQKRGKKAAEMDDMDRDFNAMHIKKLGPRKKEIDYSIVRDFTDDLRGNFIEVIHKDLFRKDPPRVLPPVTADGRPNFKKFKKKNVQRREPMRLVLSDSSNAAAEMGEQPYWDNQPADTQRGTQQKKSQATQAKSQSQSQRVAILMEEDEAPLLPRSKRRLLTQIQEEEDADDFEPVPNTRRRGTTPLTQSQADPPLRRRNARAGSAVSDRSTASSTPAPPTRATRTRRGTQATRPVVIDDDSDDEPIFATARSRTTRGTGTSGTVQASGLSTLDFDHEEPRSTRATAGSSRASGRRKLLVEDDGDDVVFQGVSKKRRLG